MSFEIRSPAFRADDKIPVKYTEDGDNVSPALTWSGVPAAAAELALIVDDPDAPQPQPWVHWVVCKLPLTATGLPEAVPRQPRLDAPAGALQGTNSWNRIGYDGPAPPRGHGTHHYHFRLYALNKPLTAPSGIDKKALLALMTGHVISQADLVGTYSR
jgi:Raf kinase inhibitor-like YbhB/YbcL family protein